MGWYAIHVRTGREDAVCEEIRKQVALVGYSADFELLVPKTQIARAAPRGGVDVIRAMFVVHGCNPSVVYSRYMHMRR